MLERKALEKRAGVADTTFADKETQTKYPTLWDYLTQTKWKDGEAREVSTLMVIPEGGVFKGMLRDRAMGVVCWVASPTLSGLFEVLEAALNDPHHEWRLDRAVSPVAKRVNANGQSVDKRKGSR